MDYDFMVEQLPTYLHVRGSGDQTPDNVRRFMVDSYRAAIEHGRDSLLMEMSFTGPPLNLGAIYAVISERSSDGSQLRYIAYVDNNAEPSREHAEFAELAAINKGVSVRLFSSVADARRSLEEQGDRTPTPRAHVR